MHVFEDFSIHKKVLCKKEQKQRRIYWNLVYSYYSFASLKWFRKVYVWHAFLIYDDKIVFVNLSLLNS